MVARVHKATKETKTGTGRLRRGLLWAYFRRRRKGVTKTITDHIRTGCGELSVTREVGTGKVMDVVLGQNGTCARALTGALTRIIRLAQEAGVESERVYNELKGIICQNRAYDPDWRMWTESCVDALASVLREK